MSRAAAIAGRARGLGWLRDYAILASCVVLFVVLAVTTPAFLTQLNLTNVLDQWGPTLIVACGATIVVIAGGFDLSAGAVFAAAGLVAAACVNELGVVAGILAALAFGAIVGAINGIVTTRLGVHSFLVTLASAMVIRGIGLAIVGGSVVITSDDAFRGIARNEIAGLRISVVIALVLAVLVALLLRRTVFGERVYAVGGSLFAARSSGVRVDLVRVLAFALSGTLAAAAGVLAASRSSGGQIGVGEGLEFTAITAVVIGGTSIAGGEGAIWRTAVGVLLLALIGNGVNLSGIDATYQQVVVGAILLVAIAADARMRRAR